MELVESYRIFVQTRAQDVDRILEQVMVIDKLRYGKYTGNYMVSKQCEEAYFPEEGSTTAIHLGTTEKQIFECVELSFCVARTQNLEKILQAIIDTHHYEEPVISVQEVLTTRSDYDPMRNNENRWWNEDKAG